ncbi:YceI family protein [Streptomyces phaeolivaceus]|uniref:YceI family protein n=1 Tax=Streptomyces phaeolivaceus TaxID=2653200 RepID=A0A5P8JX23_9ACTN|nr:YceI family protein [Streptomyces phaeolivaceus]QFQ95052.1 YceI family protein [Streptomyces phaeolivaceus]
MPSASSAPYQGLTGTYSIDPAHSTIGFSVRHAMIANVRGKFTAFEGLLKIDGSHPTRSEAHVSVQTGSLDTGIAQRDAHVTSADFLDSATFPLMTFRSTGIVDAAEGQFRMSGLLRIKDVELPLRIDLEFGGAGQDADGQNRVGFEGTATLKRSDWGIDWNSALATGGVLIGDKVKLVLDISAVELEPR